MDALDSTNMHSMFLTSKEVVELTGYTYKSKQKMQLIAKGVKFITRCDGSLCVLRDHVNRILGGTTTKKIKNKEPDEEALKEIING